MHDIQLANIDGFNPDFTSKRYRKLFIERLETRVDYIQALYGQDILPVEAKDSIIKIIEKIRSN